MLSRVMTVEFMIPSIFQTLFKRDGLKVKVYAKLRKDMGSIHMVGDIIEIIDVAAE